MANQSLLYGLGSGLIAGAVLLQLMNAVAPGNKPSPSQELAAPVPEAMSKDQIKEAAAVYFNVYEKNEKVYTQSETDALIAQRVQEEKSKAPAPAEPQNEIYIFVAPGFGVTQVSDMLYQSGVITDKKSFEDEMVNKQLAAKIVAGVHVFKGPQTLEQVTTGLTTR